MDSSKNGHTARALFIAASLPKTKDEWPRYKEIRDAALAEQAAEEAAVELERKLSEIRRLGSELRYCRDLERVKTLVESLGEIVR
jgi:hypothetical protein